MNVGSIEIILHPDTKDGSPMNPRIFLNSTEKDLKFYTWTQSNYWQIKQLHKVMLVFCNPAFSCDFFVFEVRINIDLLSILY